MAPKTSPDPVKELGNLYILTYVQVSRTGGHFVEKHFQHEGGFKGPQGAIERGKRHCQRMNYRFMNVRPFMNDLDLEEQVELGDMG